MYRLFLSRAAEEDFEQIVSYMTKKLANPIAAEHFLDAVNDCYTNLKNMPKMYEESRDPYLRSSGYRKAVIGKYILLYKIDESKQCVKIYRIFYGARNYKELL